jgi:hypothetical protein
MFAMDHESPADFGFSPSADADTNVAALQAALDRGGVVRIDTPGVYDLNATVIVQSNTKLLCCPGVVFRKVAPYCNVLINRGALTKQYDDNIVIDGLEVRVNGHEAPPSLVYGLRAQLGLHYVRNFTLRNFTCVDGEAYQYLIYIVTWSHMLIENVRLAGAKDGIKLNNGHDALVRNLDLMTYDDGTSLCGTDYPSTVVEVGDVYNVTYSNVTDHQYKDIFGRTCLIYTGSWADYKDGNEYQSGDFCINEGKLYQVVNDHGYCAIAGVAPVHGDGVVTGDDTIAWRFIQPCDFYETHVYNITFDHCTFEKSGNLIANWKEPGNFQRNFYPGTERNSNCWGVMLNHCRMTGTGPQTLLCLMGNMRDVMIDSCYFDNPRCAVIHVDQDSFNEQLVASIRGCLFYDDEDTSRFANHGDEVECPILSRHIADAGKFIAVHHGGEVICHAGGNTYRGPGMDIAITNGSKVRINNTDIPLKSFAGLTCEPGDVCRGLDGLYAVRAGEWVNVSR